MSGELVPRDGQSKAEVEARIEALGCSERMKKALRKVAEGWTYREAALEVGYRSQKNVHVWAKRAGLLQLHTQQLVTGYKRIISLSNQEIERRLEEAPEDISTKDLAVVSGIASDKVSRFEQWGQGADEPARGGGWPALLERMRDAGGGTISVTVPDPSSRAADSADSEVIEVSAIQEED